MEEKFEPYIPYQTLPEDDLRAVPEDYPEYDAYAAEESEKDPESHNRDIGQRGEKAACAFLERKGFEILHKNWKCVAGEADIVALLETDWGTELHFIEVKTRMSTANGFPEEAVTKEKRRKYEMIAELYVQQEDCGETRVTFDIISILVTAPERALLRFHMHVLSSDCMS